MQDPGRLHAGRGAGHRRAPARGQVHGGLGKPVVVENVTGAGGNIATDRVAKAAPDGYTLLMGGNCVDGLSALGCTQKLSYDPVKDFAPVTQVFIAANILAVPDRGAGEKPAELVALVRGAVRASSPTGMPGVGTSQHLGGELFKCDGEGSTCSRSPTAARTALVPDLISGRLTMCFCNVVNVHAARARGQAARVRGDLAQALGRGARSADHGGVRIPGLRGGAVVRVDGARGHARGDRREAARGYGARRSRCRTCAKNCDELGLDVDRQHASGVRRR